MKRQRIEASVAVAAVASAVAIVIDDVDIEHDAETPLPSPPRIVQVKTPFQIRVEQACSLLSDKKQNASDSRRQKQLLGELSAESPVPQASDLLQHTWAARVLAKTLTTGQFRAASWLLSNNCSWQNEPVENEPSCIVLLEECMKSKKWPRHFRPEVPCNGLQDAYVSELHAVYLLYGTTRNSSREIDKIIAMRTMAMDPTQDEKYAWLERLLDRAWNYDEIGRRLDQLKAWLNYGGPPLLTRHVRRWWELMYGARSSKSTFFGDLIRRWNLFLSPAYSPPGFICFEFTELHHYNNVPMLIPFTPGRCDLVDWLWTCAVTFPELHPTTKQPWEQSTMLGHMVSQKNLLVEQVNRWLLDYCPWLSPDVILMIARYC